jgi:hypothetical protein
MRLVAWNCKGAFAKKHSAIADLKPDVIVVPESEKLGTLSNSLWAPATIRSIEWIGNNPHKGLAVLSYGDYSLRVHEAYEPRHRWILPLVVEGPVPFLLFAVWTIPHLESKLYVQCLFEALETYGRLLESTRGIWAGDFNNNRLLDKPSNSLKYADLIPRLARLGLTSLYHLKSGEAHGAESRPTFFLQHKVEKPYHIDFIFASAALHGNGFDFFIGEYSKWHKASDHMPLVCTVQTGDAE